MTINILMIDDHPPLIEGYKTILSFNSLGHTIKAIAAYDSKTAFEIITNPINIDFFHLVFIDRALPAYEEQNILSGDDLAVLSKKMFPKTKIAIITSHTEAIILNSILKNIKPNALLIKNDLTSEELLNAFNNLLNNKDHFTQTVLKLKNETYSKDNYLDNYNSQILLLLSKGIQTKNLHNHLHLSVSAINKRKAFIKEFFGIEKGNDEDIIREAKKRGLI
jgi:two-component system, NarL family, response regulator NreC